ncbi:MAG: phage head-tail connector protein [Chloroflexota bacterium]|nr:phage head-tail connector protein [Chloroflexota bacterium]
MAYIDLNSLKAYLAITTSMDDGLLTAMIARAQAVIDAQCGRTFEAGADATRSFDALHDVSPDRRTLFVHDDLCQVTSVINGDGLSVSLSALMTEPRRRAPYYALTLKRDSGMAWTYLASPEAAVRVTGRWAFSVSAPPDIAHACLRLAAYLYRQKDTTTEVGTSAASPDGVIALPARLPLDVQALLHGYRRLTP